MKSISRRGLDYSRGVPVPADVLEVYRRDVVLRRRRGPDGEQVGGRRGAILALSRKSRQRLVLSARNIEDLPWFLTLTYPAEFPRSGRQCKRDLERVLKRIRRRWPGARGLWWLEFQVRGAPHFHMACALPGLDDSGYSEAAADEIRAMWFAVVGSGDPWHRRKGAYLSLWRSGPHGLQDYVAKESGKWVQKVVPEGFEDVGRFWALWGGAEVERRTVELPRAELAPAVRVARRSENAERRAQGLKPRSDGGFVGYTAYGAAGAVSRWFAEGGGS